MRTASVVIPHFNRGPLLEKAVASARQAQNLSHIAEILIVDDGSTEAASLACLERIEQVDGVRVLPNTGPKGAAGARNCGIQAATADWIAFLDDDDLWTADSLAARFALLDATPEACFIAGDMQVFYDASGEEDAPFFSARPGAFPMLDFTAPWQRLAKPYKTLLGRNLVFTPTVLARTDLLRAAGGFDTALWQAEDYDLWIRLGRMTDLYFLNQVVLRYRRHDRNITSTESPRRWTLKSFQALLEGEEDPAIRQLISARLSEFHAENAKWHARRGERAAAIKAALPALFAPHTRRSALRAMLGRV